MPDPCIDPGRCAFWDYCLREEGGMPHCALYATDEPTTDVTGRAAPHGGTDESSRPDRGADSVQSPDRTRFIHNDDGVSSFGPGPDIDASGRKPEEAT